MKTYLVGGAVRDELLGLEPGERDWVVVGATPQHMLDAGYRQVGRDFPVFLHPRSGEEYALARTERKSGRGHHGFAIDAAPDVTLEQDLARRDLTINAMARTAGGELIDPYGGRADLEARVLRHVSPAFTEDPLRVLRVARFAAQLAAFGFEVAAETRELMREMADSGELETLAGERVWQETRRALGSDAPWRYFEILADTGALDRVLPELAPLFGNGDEAARDALSNACRRSDSIPIRLAALTHTLDPDAELARLGRRLPLPKQWSELARLLARWHESCARAAEADARALRDLLAGCDALRRPERFESVLQTFEIIAEARGFDARPHSERLRAALAAVNGVDARELLRAGWRGEELGRELERRRLAALSRLQGSGSHCAGSE